MATALNRDYWNARAALGQLRSAAGLKSSAIQRYQTALLLAENVRSRVWTSLDDVADAPKARLNLAVMLQEVKVQSAEYHFRRLPSITDLVQADIKAMALVIFGACLESQAAAGGGNSSRLGEATVMYKLASQERSGSESVAHLRLGSVVRRIAASNSSGVEDTNFETGHRSKTWRERFSSNCDTADPPTLISRPSWMQRLRQCWVFQADRVSFDDEDLTLVRTADDSECKAGEVFQRGRRLLACLWNTTRQGRMQKLWFSVSFLTEFPLIWQDLACPSSNWH